MLQSCLGKVNKLHCTSLHEYNSTVHRQIAVTYYFSSKQLLLFAFAICTLQEQTVVTAYFLYKHLLLVTIAAHYWYR